MKREQPKADLTLLKRLVTELENALEKCYEIRDTEQTPEVAKENYQLFNVELSKSTGLLVGISREAELLAGDLNKLLQISTPNTGEEDDPVSFLKEIFSSPPSKGRGKN